ncbi:MAG: winged helix-turn-helix domain-containing protein [Saprospiraceae bacterium]
MEISPEIEILSHSDEILIMQQGKKVRIKLEHQLMQILTLLSEFEGRLIEKQLFIERIWQGNQLTGETALTKNIFKLREIFKVHGLDPWLQIETIPKKGYRLLRRGNRPVIIKEHQLSNLKVLISLIILSLILLFLFLNKSVKNGQTINSINIDAKDTVIQLGDKKVQVIVVDSNGNKLIQLDSINNK